MITWDDIPEDCYFLSRSFDQLFDFIITAIDVPDYSWVELHLNVTDYRMSGAQFVAAHGRQICDELRKSKLDEPRDWPDLLEGEYDNATGRNNGQISLDLFDAWPPEDSAERYSHVFQIVNHHKNNMKCLEEMYELRELSHD